MAVVMHMRWAGLTPEQYEQARAIVRWDEEVPDGAKLHVASFDDDGIRVIDVWDSPESFATFQSERLAAGVEAAGIEGEPDVEFLPMHALFAPALGRSETLRDI